MRNNKFLTTLMTGAMLIGSVVPAFAVVDNTQGVTETEANGGTTRATDVLYSQASTFSVTIPKQITLDGVSKTSDYSVKVEGDISSDKQVYVAPSTNVFNMIDQAIVGVKKANVEATVTHAKDVWTSAEVNALNGTTSSANNVAAKALTAGSWKGTFQFDIRMENAV